MEQNFIATVCHKDNRNTENTILSDYFNGFRLYLKKHKTGFKFYVAIRKHKKHGIEDNLMHETDVAYFKDCDINEAKTKSIEHFKWMIE